MAKTNEDVGAFENEGKRRAWKIQKVLLPIWTIGNIFQTFLICWKMGTATAFNFAVVFVFGLVMMKMIDDMYLSSEEERK